MLALAAGLGLLAFPWVFQQPYPRDVMIRVFLYALLAPSAMSYSGIHWGNRFLLVLYPLLAALAASNLATWWREVRSFSVGRGAVALAVAASLIAQCGSVLLLKQKMEFTAQLNRAVASHAA